LSNIYDLPKAAPFVEPSAKGLHDFVTTSTVRFFRFLACQKSSYSLILVNAAIREHTEQVKWLLSLWGVNDLAKCGVALIHEFNTSLTQNEEQKQFLVQVFEDHWNKFSAPTKSAAIALKQSTSAVDISACSDRL